MAKSILELIIKATDDSKEVITALKNRLKKLGDTPPIVLKLEATGIVETLKKISTSLDSIKRNVRVFVRVDTEYANLSTIKKTLGDLNADIQVKVAEAPQVKASIASIKKAVDGLPKEITIKGAKTTTKLFKNTVKTVKAWDTLKIKVKELFKPLSKIGKQVKNNATVPFNKATASIKKYGFAVKSFALAITALVAINFTDWVKTASDAITRLRAQLGLTSEAAKDLSGIGNIIYTSGAGASLIEVNDILGEVYRSFKQIGVVSEQSLVSITKSTINLIKLYDDELDPKRIIGATNTLMTNFGLTSKQALDFITSGFQNGLDASDDFLDTINEYATQFSSAGASAEQFYSLLETGQQRGVLGTDKAADSFKEYRLRILDGSKTTRDALKLLGLSSEEVTEQINSGAVTIVDVFQDIIERIKNTNEETVKMQAGTGLLGTQYEDLGKNAVEALNVFSKSLGDLEGATQKANVSSETLGASFSRFWRVLKDLVVTFFTSESIAAALRVTLDVLSITINRLGLVVNYAFGIMKLSFSFLVGAFTAVVGVIGLVIDLVTGNWEGMWDRFTSAASTAIDGILKEEADLRRIGKRITKTLFSDSNEAEIKTNAQKQMSVFKKNLDKAKTTLGLDKYKVVEGATVSEDFDAAYQAFDQMAQRFTKPTEKAKVSIQELGQAIAALSNAGSSANEIELAIRAIEQAGVEGNTKIELLKQSLTFKQEQNELQELIDQLSTFSTKTEELSENFTLLRGLINDNTKAERELQSVLTDLGIVTDTTGLRLTSLKQPITDIGDKLTKLNQIKMDELRGEITSVQQTYATQLGKIQTIYKKKKTLIESESSVLGSYARKNTALNAETLKKQLSAAQEYYQSLNQLQSSALSDYGKYANRVKSLDASIFATQEERNNSIQDLREQFYTDEEKRSQRLQEIETARAKENETLETGNYELAAQYAKNRIGLLKEIAQDENLTEEQRKNAINDASIAYNSLIDIQKQERESARQQAEDQAAIYKDLTNSIFDLTNQMQGLIGKQITVIEAKLDDTSLKTIKSQFEDIAKLTTNIQMQVDDSSLNNAITDIKNKIQTGLNNIKINVGTTSQEGDGFARGGIVLGSGTTTSDSIFARLSRGEFIIKAAAVKNYGVDFLNALNSMILPMPQFAVGGEVVPITIPASNNQTSQQKNDVVDINFNIGTERVSLMGERAQARRLLDILRKTEGIQ